MYTITTELRTIEFEAQCEADAATAFASWCRYHDEHAQLLDSLGNQVLDIPELPTLAH